MELCGNFDSSILKQQKQLVLSYMHFAKGAKQVTIEALHFSPNWIVDDAITAKLQSD